MKASVGQILVHIMTNIWVFKSGTSKIYIQIFKFIVTMVVILFHITFGLKFWSDCQKKLYQFR